MVCTRSCLLPTFVRSPFCVHSFLALRLPLVHSRLHTTLRLRLQVGFISPPLRALPRRCYTTFCLHTARLAVLLCLFTFTIYALRLPDLHHGYSLLPRSVLHSVHTQFTFTFGWFPLARSATTPHTARYRLQVTHHAFSLRTFHTRCLQVPPPVPNSFLRSLITIHPHCLPHASSTHTTHLPIFLRRFTCWFTRTFTFQPIACVGFLRSTSTHLPHTTPRVTSFATHHYTPHCALPRLLRTLPLAIFYCLLTHAGSAGDTVLRMRDLQFGFVATSLRSPRLPFCRITVFCRLFSGFFTCVHGFTFSLPLHVLTHLCRGYAPLPFPVGTYRLVSTPGSHTASPYFLPTTLPCLCTHLTTHRYHHATTPHCHTHSVLRTFSLHVYTLPAHHCTLRLHTACTACSHVCYIRIYVLVPFLLPHARCGSHHYARLVHSRSSFVRCYVRCCQLFD